MDEYFALLPVPTTSELSVYLSFALIGAIFAVLSLAVSISMVEEKSIYRAFVETKRLTLWQVGCIFFGAVIGFLVALHYGPSLSGVTVFLFGFVLLAVAEIDRRVMLIPDRFPIVIALLGVVSIFTVPHLSLLERGIGILSVSLPLFLITLLVPGAFGGGDIKLMAAVGLFLGWKLSAIAALAAILTGGFYGIILLVFRLKSRKDEFAFGPFLCFGIYFALFFGAPVVAYFTDFFSVFAT